MVPTLLLLQFSTVKWQNMAGAGAGAEIMVEPEQKINNFGSATLVLYTTGTFVFLMKIPITFTKF